MLVCASQKRSCNSQNGEIIMRKFFQLSALVAATATFAPVNIHAADIVTDGKSQVTIIAPDSGPPRFAAEIFQKYVAQMTGAKLPIDKEPLVGDAGPQQLFAIRFEVEEGAAKNDGFVIERTPGRLHVRASEPRGCIYGAFALLELLGCRFYGSEPLGVIVPKTKTLSIADDLKIARQPSFPNRFPTGLNRDEQLWLGTNNTGAARDEEGRAWIAKTGLRQFGWGHLWPDLIAKQFYADGRAPVPMDYSEKKDWLPADAKGNRRQNNMALCFTNEQALDWFADNMAQWILANHRDSAMFSMWPADIEALGECHCETCAAKQWNATDWCLLVHNATWRKLQEKGWKGNFGWIAYHISERLPTEVGLVGNGKQMDFMYAPRPRGGTTVGPFTNDAKESVKYRKNLADWNAYLDKHKFEGTRTVFEYYWDMVLVGVHTLGRTLIAPTPEWLQQDMRFYHNNGFDGFYHCCGGWRVWFPDPLTRWLYYKLQWDVNLDLETAKKDFYTNYYTALGMPVRELRETIERAMIAPPTAQSVKQLHKQAEAAESLLKAAESDPILRARVKSFVLWTQYCAQSKESEFHRAVTKDEDKGLDAEDAAQKMFKENREFFVENNLMSQDNFDVMVSVAQWHRSRFNEAIARRLPFDIAASSEHPDAPAVCAFDGDPNQPWGSGKLSPCWIEAKFRAPRELKGVELFCLQRPDGDTRHEIIIEDEAGERTVKVFEGFTKSGDWLKVEFEKPLQNVKRLRVLTTKSTNFVAWGEIVIK
jgi:hypothetical protein